MNIKFHAHQIVAPSYIQPRTFQLLTVREDLERGIAVVDERRQFQAQHARRRNFDDESEGNADMAIAVGPLVRGFSA